MDVKRDYRRRGTPDLQMATYIGIASKNMYREKVAKYHPETEIFLQISGTTTKMLGSKKIVTSPGDIHIIAPNTAHCRLDFSPDAKSHRIVFSPNAIRMQEGHFFQEEFVKPLEEGRLELPELLQPGHPAYEAVYQLMMQLESCRIFEKNYRQQRLHILMGVCLALMPYCRVVADPSPISDPGHEGVKLCKRYLHNHHTQKLTLGEVAEHCHLHPNYLCKIFRENTGESIFEYLTRIRVESAQRLLLDGLPVSVVAELSGFHSERLLYRKFKEQTGMTPKAYAKENRKIYGCY